MGPAQLTPVTALSGRTPAPLRWVLGPLDVLFTIPILALPRGHGDAPSNCGPGARGALPPRQTPRRSRIQGGAAAATAYAPDRRAERTVPGTRATGSQARRPNATADAAARAHPGASRSASSTPGNRGRVWPPPPEAAGPARTRTGSLACLRRPTPLRLERDRETLPPPPGAHRRGAAHSGSTSNPGRTRGLVPAGRKVQWLSA